MDGYTCRSFECPLWEYQGPNFYTHLNSKPFNVICDALDVEGSRGGGS